MAEGYHLKIDFEKYLLDDFYMWGALLSAKDSAVSKIDTVPVSWPIYIELTYSTLLMFKSLHKEKQ